MKTMTTMMLCSPAMMFCSIVGQASRQTAGPIGPSTMERSKRCAGFGAGEDAATTGPASGTGDEPAAMAASVSSNDTPPSCQPSAFFGNSDHCRSLQLTSRGRTPFRASQSAPAAPEGEVSPYHFDRYSELGSGFEAEK